LETSGEQPLLPAAMPGGEPTTAPRLPANSPVQLPPESRLLRVHTRTRVGRQRSSQAGGGTGPEVAHPGREARSDQQSGSVKVGVIKPYRGTLPPRQTGCRLQRDRLTAAKEGLGLVKQVVLQGFAVVTQRVRCAVRAVLVHRLEVEVHQLAQARALLPPGMRGQLAARGRPCGQRCGPLRRRSASGSGPARRVCPPRRMAHHRECCALRAACCVLRAHAARSHQPQRSEIDLLEAFGFTRIHHPLHAR